MDPIKPSRHQVPLPLDRLILKDRGEGETLEMDVLFVGAGPAGLAGAIELAKLVAKDNESGGGLGEVGIGVLEKAESLGEHSLSGAVVNPRALRELFPGLKDEELPAPREGREGARPLPDGARLRAAADPPDDAQRRLLHRLDLRAGPLARGEGGGARRQHLHRLSGGGAARRGEPRRGRADHGDGARPRRAADVELHGAERPRREGHGPVRRIAGDAVAGLVRVAAGLLGEPSDLRAGREGGLGDEAAARFRDSHHGLAAPFGRLRRQLHVPARAEPGLDRPGGGARLPRRLARRPRADAEDEAAPRSSGPGSKGASWWSGARRRSPRGATTRSRPAATATGS